MWKRLVTITKWRRLAVWLVVVALTSAALCFVPLLNLLGYEFSLVIATVTSLGSGLIAAAYPSRIRDQLAPYPGARWTVFRLFVVVAGLGWSLLAAPLILVSLNALRVRNCDYLEGLGFFILGPVMGVTVAAAYGLAAGLVTPGRRSASLLFAAVWIAAVAFELYDVWATPSVRALGSFHGYFSGVLYDEAVTIPIELLSFRARDTIEVAALLCLCSWLIDRSKLQLSLRAGRSERKRLPLAAALSVVAIAGGFAGAALGHRRSAEAVAQALGGRIEFERCEVFYPASLSSDDAELIARDCAFRLHQVETFFGVELEHGQKLRVFLFSDPDQKQELMGAGRTSIAKPWRQEVYIQGVLFPHPVLKHEIAHVVAGVFGAHPLRVSGTFGGVVASPGLIEGAAVAAAWSETELTPHAWSKAMVELDVVPPMSDVMSLRFLGLNASRAYVLAGSFSRFLIDTHGVALYRKAYRTADIPGTYGHSIDHLEREWRESLSEIELRPGDMERAKARFDGPAVFGKICAHEVAQLRKRATTCEAVAAWDDALEIRRRVEQYSGGDGISRLELANTLLLNGDQDEAAEVLDELGDSSSFGVTYQRAAKKLGADLQWFRGRNELALETYRELSEQPSSESESRMITVKLTALEHERAEPYLKRFLIGGMPFGSETPDLAMLTLAEMIAELPDLGLAQYLLGRQLWIRGHFDRALPYFSRARELGLPTASLRAENLRLEAISLFRLGQLDRSRQRFLELANDESRPSGARARALDWVDRCDWEESPRSSGISDSNRDGGRTVPVAQR